MTTLFNRITNLTEDQAETYRNLFNHIVATIQAYDPEFYWKDAICFEEVYTDVDRANLIIEAITFMVGGKTDIAMTQTADGLICTYTNPGYYRSTGA